MRIKAIGMLIALAVLVSCDEGPTGPTTEDFSKEREALVARQKVKRRAPASAAPAAAKVGPMTPEFAATAGGFTYESSGVRDPFRSFEWEEKGRKAILGNDRGPLEQYDIGQMSLLAVVWNTGVARALVRDPAGKSYIVGTGTRMGKNEGRVTNINDNLVVVKETYVDFLGQETTKDIEMRIRRSEGG
ncbi:MAG: pilus assembly protein PilP [Deltaproteobacteria bacterium]|nr:pilus assembly protein PilP [Deltaproteobacteria bacterium]MBW2399296.1 pilus assembly protein PilP [Deltaproteobacteria bacterium]MBW2665910.1 pilus assembly protein PilP [Deltaproteobacteria bacterium]